MAATSGGDFAALLDELLAERQGDSHAVPPASLDYLSVVEELHSGRINFADKAALAEYQASTGHTGKAGRQEVEPPSIDPVDVARELGFKPGRRPRDLDRARRDFAFRNHPDRVAADLRERAMLRMQIANMLIDDAKRAGKKPKR